MTEQPRLTFDDLYAYRAWVRTLASRLTDDAADASDVEQQVWLTAIARPPRRADAPRAWLSTVTANTARNLRRALRRRARHETAAAALRAGSPADELAAEAEAQQVLVRAVLDLDEPYRETVLLRYFEGLETAEVAARLDVLVETVRTRLKRARERLRARLDRRFGGRATWGVLLTGRPVGGAPTSATSTTSATSAGAAIGGTVMAGATTKLAIAAAVIVTGAAILWHAHAGTPRSAAPETARAPSANRPRARPTIGQDAVTARPPADPTTPGLPLPVDLDHVDRDLDLHGVVVDTSGSPITGAELATVTRPWRRLETLNRDGARESVPGPATRSAVDGTFALRLPRGALVDLRVRSEGYAEIGLPRRQAGERVRVVLPRGVALVVAARDESGAPVAGAVVRFFRMADAGDPDFDREATTDSAGRCRFDALPATCSGALSAESAASHGWRPDVVLPEKGETTVELVLALGRAVHGRVLDADTSAPIADARVGVGWTLRNEVRSRADGGYELAGVLAGEEVHALADGHARGLARVGDDGVADVALRRGIDVRGRVVDAAGGPVESALVSVIASWTNESRAQQLSLAHATTDSAGLFSVAGLAPDRPHALLVWAAGHARLRREISAAAADVGVLDQGDITLDPPRAIEGVVVDAAGAPVPRVAVKLSGSRDAEADAFARVYGSVESRSTDDLGRFRFPDIGPGDYRVTARLPDRTETTVAVHVPAERDVRDVTLRLPSMREVVVHVRDDAGAPLAGVVVMWDPIPPGTPHPRSDATGTVRLLVPVDTRTVVAYAAFEDPRAFLPSGFERLPTTPGSAEITLTLRRGAKISGTLLDPDGRPIPGVSEVRAQFADGKRTNAVTEADGGFSMNVPREGLCTVTFAAEVSVGSPPQLAALVARREGVAPGTSLVLRTTAVARGLRVIVRLLSADGRPVADRGVSAVALHGGGGASGKTGADGRATLAGLPEWEHSIDTSGAFRPEDGFPPRPVVIVPAGQEIVLRNRPSAPITGEVVDADGRPVQCGVELRLGAEYFCGAGTDAAGKFSLPCPVDEPGPYTVKAYRWGDRAERTGTEAKDLAPGTSGVRLVLR